MNRRHFRYIFLFCSERVLTNVLNNLNNKHHNIMQIFTKIPTTCLLSIGSNLYPTICKTKLQIKLKEYSVILTSSFYGMNQKI